MKKRVLALAVATACAFGFVACDGMENLDIVGHINLTASNPTGGEQAYQDGQTINFASAMCNVNIDSVYIEAGEYSGTYDINAGTVFAGTTQALITNDQVNISFPLCGINLRDTVTGTYAISCPINDFALFEHLDTTDVGALINSGLALGDNIGNLFAVAVSDTSYYLGFSGEVVLTTYGGLYTRVQGTVNNVEAIYVTKGQIEAIAAMDETERAGINLENYFPHITFNGQISSMRADIALVMQALDEME